MSQHIPPIQCLLTFETLARRGSMALAAHELCVTHSAVSHRIRKLEHVVGTKLFDPSARGLTAAGSEYLQHVRQGLGLLRRRPVPLDADQVPHRA